MVSMITSPKMEDLTIRGHRGRISAFDISRWREFSHCITFPLALYSQYMFLFPHSLGFSGQWSVVSGQLQPLCCIKVNNVRAPVSAGAANGADAMVC